MINVIIAVILLIILGSAGMYVYKAKKSGAKCIGCPASKCGSKNCSCCCSEHSETEK